MKWLIDNPILIAQLRLARRTGYMVPACLVFALVYLSILLGGGEETPDENAIMASLRRWDLFWLLLVQGLAWVLGSFSKVSREVQEDSGRGILDFHRLSPLTPGQILAGYLIGAPAREWLLGVMGALASLVFVERGRISLSTWAALQGLFLSTAILAQLLGAFVGLTLKRRGPVVLGSVGFVVLMMPNSLASGTSLLNFLVPNAAMISLLAGLFGKELPAQMSQFLLARARPNFFGISCDPFLFTWLVQGVLGFVIWRAISRRLKHRDGPPLSQGEGAALFLTLTVTQFGLITGIPSQPGLTSLMAAVSLALSAGGVILFAQSAYPWRLRKQLHRQRKERKTKLVLDTATSWAFFFLVVVSVLLSFAVAKQQIPIHASSLQIGPAMALIIASVGVIFFGVVLVIESFRLWLERHSTGYQGLALFVLWVLPLILGAFFGYRIELITLSPLAIPPLVVHGLSVPWWLTPEDVLAMEVGLSVQAVLVAAAGVLWWQQRRLLIEETV